MSYSDFTMEKIREQFALDINNADLFNEEIPQYTLSGSFLESLSKGMRLGLAIDTEKAKSEFIVAPLLLELKSLLEKEISIFSGIELNVDREKGLNGVCDFLISKSNRQFILTHPIVALVEAKNGYIGAGLGQCMAEMYAAQLYNQSKKMPVQTIYGIVTTGTEWKFLKLQGNSITIDNNEYYINEPVKLFSILVYIVSQS